MRNAIQCSWKAKRNKAIERLITAWENYGEAGNEDPEPINVAADAITIAHIAASLEWESGPVQSWQEEEGKAMMRLVRAWIKYARSEGDDPEAEEELNIALDALAIAHTAAALEGRSGPVQW